MRDLSLKCLQIHYEVKEIIEANFGFDTFYTLGYVQTEGMQPLFIHSEDVCSATIALPWGSVLDVSQMSERTSFVRENMECSA